jgi:thiol peroxidase
MLFQRIVLAGLAAAIAGVVMMIVSPATAGEQAHVTLHGKALNLVNGSSPLQVGQTLPNVSLPDVSLNLVDLKMFRGKVTILSVVPSLDTPTCEKQTHILSEESEGLDQKTNLVTISRDLPFAQKRFAKEAGIGNIRFLSDYRDAAFGLASGLLIEENRLLTRAVLVLDGQGVIRHLEIVPELGHLPDMKRAFALARELLSIP